MLGGQRSYNNQGFFFKLIYGTLNVFSIVHTDFSRLLFASFHLSRLHANGESGRSRRNVFDPSGIYSLWTLALYDRSITLVLLPTLLLYGSIEL